MKKYLIVSEGSEPTVSSNCLNRAKAYAEEMLRTEPEGTPVHIYVHQLRASRSAISWSSTLPRKTSKPKKLRLVVGKGSPKTPEPAARAPKNHTRTGPENIPFANRHWTKEDLKKVVDMSRGGADNAHIATVMGRSEKSIELQLYRVKKGLSKV